jgi:hypothetical protein
MQDTVGNAVYGAAAPSGRKKFSNPPVGFCLSRVLHDKLLLSVVLCDPLMLIGRMRHPIQIIERP